MMALYFVLFIGVVMLGIGFAIGCLLCKTKVDDELSGRLFITESSKQPFLVASVPMETMIERKYVVFEVKSVDDSQK